MRTRLLFGGRVPLLARMRVGTKLMLLVLLPVCGLMAVIVFAAVDRWRDANRLRDFRTATGLSFAIADVTDALATERTTTVLRQLDPDAVPRAELAAAQRAVGEALRRATERATPVAGPVDTVGRLDAARRQLGALRLQTGTGSLTEQETAEAYGDVVRELLDVVGDLDTGRPSRDSGRAADAYVAILQAAEAAERERLDVADALAPRGEGQPSAAARWITLESAELEAFRQNAAGRLTAELHAVIFSPAGVRVQRLRDELVSDPERAIERSSLEGWLDASGARISALRRVQREAGAGLATAASRDLDAAQETAIRDVALSLAVLIVVMGLALALRRSITRPLSEVSEGARRLSSGDLTSDVQYAGRDEIGDVATAFRDLRVTAEQFAGDIRELNAAVRENRLDHRADIGAFEGTWSQLLAGMNDTVAAFAELQAKRERAERQSERIFNLSLDLLCISGVDGYFKRVNPAFERTLGYTSDELLSRPFLEFVHPDDRERTAQARDALAHGDEVVQFENRYMRSDGSACWLQWSARPEPQEGLIYAAARDVTEPRRAAAEQAALRRVATLVAQGVSPATVFSAVAGEVGRLLDNPSAAILRYEPDGTMTVLGSAPGGLHAQNGAVARAVASTHRATRTDGLVSAPIVVEDRVWGVIVVASTHAKPLPPGTETRLNSFTELVATAIANAESRAELAASRARIVTAADEARRRIERDLHDGVQQRLVSLLLQARDAEAMAGDQPQLKAQLSTIVSALDSMFDDVREIALGIHPAILSKGGLAPAIKTLGRRSAIPVEADVPTGLRVPQRVEVAAYYVVSEALANATKHAQASVVRVTVALGDGVLELSVRDDGVGGAKLGAGSGLIGLIDRVEALGGRLRVISPAGGGTTLMATLPLAERGA
jgi:PAS domain S-box-containing protein